MVDFATATNTNNPSNNNDLSENDNDNENNNKSNNKDSKILISCPGDAGVGETSHRSPKGSSASSLQGICHGPRGPKGKIAVLQAPLHIVQSPGAPYLKIQESHRGHRPGS